MLQTPRKEEPRAFTAEEELVVFTEMGSDDENAEELAHNERKRGVFLAEQEAQWRATVLESRALPRLERINSYRRRIPLIRNGWGILFLFLLALLLFWWQIFAWALTSVTWAGVPLFLYGRVLTYALVIFGAVFVVVSIAAKMTVWFSQTYYVLDLKAFIYSFTLTFWGLICLLSYQPISGSAFRTNCETSNGTVADSGSAAFTYCFTFRWLFTAAIVVGIMWIVLSFIEELVLYKLEIRPNSEQIQISLRREHSLYQVVHFMRDRGVVPKRKDPANDLPDLDMKVKHLTELCLMDQLKKRRVALGRFSRNIKRRNAVTKTIKRMAKDMFDYLDTDEDNQLSAEEFKQISPRHYEELFHTFNPALAPTLSRDDWTEQVRLIYFARTTVWDSFADRQNISATLKSFVGSVFWLVALIVVMIMADISLNAVIIPAASFVLGFSFAFGSVVSLMLQSAIMILFVRPFDVGDKVTFGLPGTAPNFFVYKIGLMRTIMMQTNGTYYSFPNSDLITTKIQNLTRSGAFVLSLSLAVAYETPTKKIVRFKRAVEEYMKENSDDFSSKSSFLYVDKLIDMNRFEVGVWAELKATPWSDWTGAQKIKLELLMHIKRTAEHLGVEYHQVPQVINTRMGGGGGGEVLPGARSVGHSELS